MSDQNDFNEKRYGYFFHTRERPDSPGHPQLDVFLRFVPTEKHFDPIKMTINVAVGGKDIEFIKVHHPWPLLEHYRACSGRVILEDRKGKVVEAFTFGGDLRIESKEELTIGMLTSPAPILELTSAASILSMLAEEIEIIFAERRAEWEPDHRTFNEKLITADPFVLYCACLENLRERYEQSHVKSDEEVQKFKQFVHNEIANLQELNQWPAQLPTVAKLL